MKEKFKNTTDRFHRETGAGGLLRSIIIRVISRYSVYGDFRNRAAGKQVLTTLLFSVTALFSLNVFAAHPAPVTIASDTGSGSGSSNNGNTWTQQAKLLANDGSGGVDFGGSVAINGDTALVGVRWDDKLGAEAGSAYVFVRDPATGTWTQQAKLLANDGTAGDQFGGSVDINGDTALIGANRDSDLGPYVGSVYVFVRNPVTGAWTQQAKLLASDYASGDEFGGSVAVSGDTALIGARYNDDKGQSSGSAYVFTRNSVTGAWTEQAKLLASDGAPVDYFGWSVAVSGDTAVIGAYSDDDTGLNSGSVYVFVRNPATGAWSEQDKLLAGDGMGAEWFGWSVAISGDTIITGAYKDYDLGTESGSAYVYVRNPITGAWSEQAKLLASDGAEFDGFGYAVGISGNTALVGAFRDSSDLGIGFGSVYGFVRNPATGNWTQQAKLLANDGTAGDQFGVSVAISGSTGFIGAFRHGDQGFNSGSAYVFEVSDKLLNDDIVINFGSIGLWARINDSSWLKLNNSSPDDVITGDVDGNGVDDVISDFGSTFGGIFIKRNAGAWAKLHNSSPQSMATGDLDGNGKDDIVIDFGGIGLWARMNDSAWLKLNNSSPDQIIVGDVDGNGMDDVIADFSSTFGGIFIKRNQGGWSKLHNNAPGVLAVGDLDNNGKDDLVIDFGAIGLWVRMNDAAWLKLHNSSPDLVATGDVDGNGADDVLATFPGQGLWQKLNLGGWGQLNANAPDELLSADVDGSGQDDIIAKFGSTIGGIFVKRNGGAWTKLHNTSPDSMAVGNLDGL